MQEFEEKETEKNIWRVFRGKYFHFWASDEGGGLTRPEKESVRTRRVIEEVVKFDEGVWIKAWGQ